MPALVRALKRVDLPTLGKPTMPHLRLMKKVLINQDPSCTIEPNTGMVEVPDLCRCVGIKVQSVPSNNHAERALFVLVLSWDEWS